MDLHKKKIIDFEQPLENEANEKFCNEYVRLDLEEFVSNKRLRRIKAYRFSYPETIKDLDGNVNSRAVNLLNKKHIKDRIAFLYEQEGSSVESMFAWTKSKSEGILVGIAYNAEEKTSDRIKAVSELNKMRGIEAPEKIEEDVSKESSVDSFFSKFKGVL